MSSDYYGALAGEIADEGRGWSAKLSHIIAALVLNRQEWEAAGSGQEGMEARKRVACSSEHKTPAGGKNLPATVIEDNQHEAVAPRCPECCEHGLPYSAENQRRFGAPGWCGWCEDVAAGYADPIPADEPQWRCPHGVGRDT